MKDECSFEEHIHSMITKTKGLSSWILRTFKSREKHLMLTLWKSLVIPHFDYCSPLWSPDKKCLIQAIEKVQRSFMRHVNGIRDLDYWEQLKTLKLYSLERRRERFQIIYTWSILENLVPNCGTMNNRGEMERGIKWYNHIRQGRKCEIPLISRGKYQNMISSTFHCRGPKLFNCLPKYLRNLTGCSKDHFKLKLDGYLSSVPDEPQLPNYTIYRRADSNSIADMCTGLYKMGV